MSVSAQVAQASNALWCWVMLGIADFKQMYVEYDLCYVLFRKLIKVNTYLWIRVLLSLFLFLGVREEKKAAKIRLNYKTAPSFAKSLKMVGFLASSCARSLNSWSFIFYPQYE